MKYIDIEDLVPGQWYHTDDLDYYFKFSHIERRYTLRIWYYKKIKRRNELGENDWFDKETMIATITQVEDPSIILKYFPNEKLEIYYDIY